MIINVDRLRRIIEFGVPKKDHFPPWASSSRFSFELITICIEDVGALSNRHDLRHIAKKVHLKPCVSTLQLSVHLKTLSLLADVRRFLVSFNSLTESLLSGIPDTIFFSNAQNTPSSPCHLHQNKQ